MAIKRYTATADTTITNAYKADMITRGTDGNMGASDTMEVFSIYAQAASGSAEAARSLVQFSTTDIASDRASDYIPASGSVSFYLRLFNAEHAQTTPTNFTMTVTAVSRSWREGLGLDMEGYTDLDNANWVTASSGAAGPVLWTAEGGDYWVDSSSSFDVDFETGVEDLEVDVTHLVEQWLAGTKNNYGFGVKLSGSHETETRSYYTKRFFARGSEYFFKRPTLEARWDSSEKDNRGNFFVSSSLATPADNLNTLYLYNNINGQLKNIPSIGTGNIYVKLYTSGANGEVLTPTGAGALVVCENAVTGGFVSTGVYSASFALSTTASVVYDRWYSGSNTGGGGGGGTIEGVLHTSSFVVDNKGIGDTRPHSDYVSSITNLKSAYSRQESARFRIFTRKKQWNPTIYTKSSTEIPVDIVDDAFFKIFRIVDDKEIIGYGTGSLNHTRLSYDVSGSYFDLDMSMLEAGYAYGIKLLYSINSKYWEQSEEFKFRVE